MSEHSAGTSSPQRALPSVLVVDDELSMAEMLTDRLAEHGYDATASSSSQEASRLLEQDRFDALVTDLRMAGIDGLGLLEISKRAVPDRPVIVMTAYSAIDSAIESIRRGAYHYLTKPFPVAELALFLARALDEARLRREAFTLRKALKERFSVASFVVASQAMRGVCQLIERVADADVPVLITGETGTGKGLVAHAIHTQGRRSSGPFVRVNCAALPENLLESELFGHVKGAFTGATSHRTGLFTEADLGTLFLDEIGELSPALQAKLLDVLERGVVRAIGSNKERQVDVRVLAATHHDLHGRVSTGHFREDLLYRLDVVTIELPPLRHRRDDIPALINCFLEQSRAKYPQSEVKRFSDEALERLCEHDWPGNVRELKHLVERLVLLGRSSELSLAELPPAMRSRDAAQLRFGDQVVPLREVQRRYVAWAYEQLGGRKLLTAEKLGIDDKTLTRWLSKDPEWPGS